MIKNNFHLLKNKCPQQVSLMQEKLIVVNELDEPIWSVSKLQGHSKEFAKDMDLPHRAFSVFLFNKNLELLLQERSKEKITFPNMWTNTCCSHPLFEADEMEEVEGIKVAAIR